MAPSLDLFLATVNLTLKEVLANILTSFNQRQTRIRQDFIYRLDEILCDFRDQSSQILPPELREQPWNEADKILDQILKSYDYLHTTYFNNLNECVSSFWDYPTADGQDILNLGLYAKALNDTWVDDQEPKVRNFYHSLLALFKQYDNSEKPTFDVENVPPSPNLVSLLPEVEVNNVQVVNQSVPILPSPVLIPLQPKVKIIKDDIVVPPLSTINLEVVKLDNDHVPVSPIPIPESLPEIKSSSLPESKPSSPLPEVQHVFVPEHSTPVFSKQNVPVVPKQKAPKFTGLNPFTSSPFSCIFPHFDVTEAFPCSVVSRILSNDPKVSVNPVFRPIKNFSSPVSLDPAALDPQLPDALLNPVGDKSVCCLQTEVFPPRSDASHVPELSFMTSSPVHQDNNDNTDSNFSLGSSNFRQQSVKTLTRYFELPSFTVSSSSQPNNLASITGPTTELDSLLSISSRSTPEIQSIGNTSPSEVSNVLQAPSIAVDTSNTSESTFIASSSASTANSTSFCSTASGQYDTSPSEVSDVLQAPTIAVAVDSSNTSELPFLASSSASLANSTSFRSTASEQPISSPSRVLSPPEIQEAPSTDSTWPSPSRSSSGPLFQRPVPFLTYFFKNHSSTSTVHSLSTSYPNAGIYHHRTSFPVILDPQPQFWSFKHQWTLLTGSTYPLQSTSMVVSSQFTAWITTASESFGCPGPP